MQWTISKIQWNTKLIIIESVKHNWAFGTPPWLQNEVSLPMSWRGRFYNCRKICVYAHFHHGDSPPCLIFHLYFCFCFLIYENKIKSCVGESECPPLSEGVPRWPHLSRTFLMHFLEFLEKRGMGKHFPRSPQAPKAWETRGACPQPWGAHAHVTLNNNYYHIFYCRFIHF